MRMFAAAVALTFCASVALAAEITITLGPKAFEVDKKCSGKVNGEDKTYDLAADVKITGGKIRLGRKGTAVEVENFTALKKAVTESTSKRGVTCTATVEDGKITAFGQGKRKKKTDTE